MVPASARQGRAGRHRRTGGPETPKGWIMFRLEIETDNAAFEEDPSAEVARILAVAAVRIKGGYTAGELRDINGNFVGRFDLTL